MPGDNLTRLEAQERKALLNVDSYDVTLDLTTGDEVFLSTTTVRFSATAGASTFIDAFTRTVHSIELNGVAVDTAAADGVRIQLDNLVADNVLTVVADAEYTNSGEGLHRFVDPVDGEVYLYSQFEVPDSRRVFAVFEQPDLKAEFRFTVVAPAAWEVVSNQRVEVRSPTGDTATWVFKTTPRISSYITAIVAGPYAKVTSELTSSDGRTIPLGIYSRKSLSQYLDSDYIFDITRKGFTYYEEKFDYAYPFEKYDQLFVPEFNAGAMENAGAVTFTETYVFRSKVTDAIKERRVVTILHELAHMWFGDLVTMKWWNDLWLNESFAEWASTISTANATEWTEAWTTFQAMEKSWAYRQDQLPSTHPVVATINDLEDVQVNFDGITYAKGGSVLKQLVAWVGEDAFFAGVAAYFKKHAFGNTELKDLLAELEITSGRELTDWSKLWLETAGVNTLRPSFDTDTAGNFTSFAVLQTAVPDYPTIRPHRLAIGLYNLDSGKLVRTHRHELDVDGERTEVPELVGMAKPDLVLINDDDLAYAKIRLDADSLGVALEHLKDIENPLARALVWGSVWDATRDAETKPSDYVTLVLRNIATETESTTIRTTLNQLALVAKLYVNPFDRAKTLERVGSDLWTLVQLAEPGSDAQFQFVKFFAHLASVGDHVAALRGLLDGTVVLKGLEIDTDLGWELLEGLVLNGAATPSDIDAMLAKDNTANGAQAAARARATFPTAEAKLAAFDSLVDPSTGSGRASSQMANARASSQMANGEASSQMANGQASSQMANARASSQMANGQASSQSANAQAPIELSNAIVRATTVGYQHVNDPAPLEPVVEKYFSALDALWASRSYHIAETLVVGLYPAPLASQSLANATNAWLAANPDVPALRRLVIENLAGVERALAAQTRDAQ